MDDAYLDDIGDLLASVETNLLALEKSPNDSELIEHIFRDLHTIKGASYMFDRKFLGDFIHDIENVFDDVRNNEVEVDKILIQNSLNSIDLAKEILKLNSKEEVKKKDDVDFQLGMLKENVKKKSSSSNNTIEKPEAFLYLLSLAPKIEIKSKDDHPIHFILEDLKEANETLEKIDFKKRPKNSIINWTLLIHTSQSKDEIESLFLFVEDDFNIILETYPIQDPQNFKLSDFEQDLTDNKIKELQVILNSKISTEETKKVENKPQETTQKESIASEKNLKDKIKSNSYIKVSRSKVEDLMSWVSELITLQATLNNEAKKFESEALFRISESMDFITENLRETIFSISLVSLKRLETRFERLIRDLTDQLEKKIDFQTSGMDTELDKKIIENLSDPLLHIIRNSMDHGIESPKERTKAGKNETGKIKFEAYYNGNSVYIDISDDGKGIDPKIIKQKAIERNLVSAEDNLTDEETIQLIFHSGFSTAEQVSDLSGRGVGMDVVRKKIQELRGEVTVESEKGVGTKIQIKIPLSLSILEGLLTKVGDTYFVLPLNVVREIHRINKSEYHELPPGTSEMVFNGKRLPVISLEQSFNIHSDHHTTSDVVSVDIGIKKKGIAVDEIKGQIKAVLKPLSKYYEDQEYIAGGTILGNGKLALVLDLEKFINQN